MGLLLVDAFEPSIMINLSGKWFVCRMMFSECMIRNLCAFTARFSRISQTKTHIILTHFNVVNYGHSQAASRINHIMSTPVTGNMFPT